MALCMQFIVHMRSNDLEKELMVCLHSTCVVYINERFQD